MHKNKIDFFKDASSKEQKIDRLLLIAEEYTNRILSHSMGMNEQMQQNQKRKVESSGNKGSKRRVQSNSQIRQDNDSSNIST